MATEKTDEEKVKEAEIRRVFNVERAAGKSNAESADLRAEQLAKFNSYFKEQSLDQVMAFQDGLIATFDKEREAIYEQMAKETDPAKLSLLVAKRNDLDLERGKVFRNLAQVIGSKSQYEEARKDRSDPTALRVVREIEATTEEWKRNKEVSVQDDAVRASDAPTVTSPPVQPKQTFAQRFMAGVRGVVRNTVNAVANSRIATRIREAVTGKQVIAKVGPASPEEQKEIEQKFVQLAAETKAADEKAENAKAAETKVDALLSALTAAANAEPLESSAQQKASFPQIGQEDELSDDELNEMDEMIGDLNAAPVASESPVASEPEQTLAELIEQIEQEVAEKSKPMTEADMDEVFDAINASDAQNAEPGPQEPSMTEEEFMAEANPPDPEFEQELSKDMEDAAKQEALNAGPTEPGAQEPSMTDASMSDFDKWIAEAEAKHGGNAEPENTGAVEKTVKIDQAHEASALGDNKAHFDNAMKELDALLNEPAKGAVAEGGKSAVGAKKLDLPTIPSGREGPSRG